VTVLNRAMTLAFDAITGPLERLPAMAGLSLLSLATAVAVLLAFKWTADQRALATSRRGMQAALFEMRLFNDDLAALLRAQREVLRHTLTYLRLSLSPTLWLIVPMLALMLHMEFGFGYTGLMTGEAALVKAHLADGAGRQQDAVAPGPLTPGGLAVSLEAGDAVRVETPAVVLPTAREIAWRIRPRAAGSYELGVRRGEEVLSKTLVVSDRVTRRSPVRPAEGFLNQLRYPSEAPLPKGSDFTAITIEYPERPYTVAGWNIGWSGVYLALTLLFALALKGVFGVAM
jgi:hypothetical protein